MSLLVALLIWLCAGTWSLISDVGYRERRHLTEAGYLHGLVDAERNGLLVRDLAPMAVLTRRTTNLFWIPRVAVLILATWALTRTSWSVPTVAVMSAIALTMMGTRSRWLLALRGYHDHTAPAGARRWADSAAGVVKVVTAAVGFLGVGLGARLVGSGSVIIGVAAIAAGVLLVSVAHLPSRLTLMISDRALATPARGFGDHADRESLLLLRSFSDDQVSLRSLITSGGPGYSIVPGARYRFEELVAASLFTDGRLVAIGRPGERLSELGAARTYYPDDAWQEAVRTTAHRSAGVFLIAGSTEGLAWELEQLHAWGLLNKVLVVLPPEPDHARAVERTQWVYRVLAGRELPATWDPHVAVAMSRQLNQVVLYACDGRDWASYVTALLVFVQEQHGAIPKVQGAGSGTDVIPTLVGPPQKLGLRDQRMVISQSGNAMRTAEDGRIHDAVAQFDHLAADLRERGLTGAAAATELLAADALRQAGRPTEAVARYRAVADGITENFAFTWIGQQRVTSSGLEIEALSSLAELANEGHGGSPWSAHEALYAATVRGRVHDRAGRLAADLAERTPRLDFAANWYARAADHLHTAGDQPALGRVYLSWGRRLSHEDPAAARRHLRVALEILDAARLDEVAEAKSLLADLPAVGDGLTITDEARPHPAGGTSIHPTQIPAPTARAAPRELPEWLQVRINEGFELAVLALARRRPRRAVRHLTGIASTARASEAFVSAVFADLRRSEVLTDMGKVNEALRVLEAAWQDIPQARPILTDGQVLDGELMRTSLLEQFTTVAESAPALSAACLERLVTWSAAHDDKPGEADACAAIAALVEKAGKFATARQWYDRAASAYEAIGDPGAVGAMVAWSGATLAREGFDEHADAAMVRAIDITGDRPLGHLVWAYERLGDRAVLNGDLIAARDHFEKAMDVARLVRAAVDSELDDADLRAETSVPLLENQVTVARSLVTTLDDLDDRLAARQIERELIALLRELVEQDSSDNRRRHLSVVLDRHAHRIADDDLPGAITIWQEALQLDTQLAASGSQSDLDNLAAGRQALLRAQQRLAGSRPDRPRNG